MPTTAKKTASAKHVAAIDLLRDQLREAMYQLTIYSHDPATRDIVDRSVRVLKLTSPSYLNRK